MAWDGMNRYHVGNACVCELPLPARSLPRAVHCHPMIRTVAKTCSCMQKTCSCMQNTAALLYTERSICPLPAPLVQRRARP